MEEKKNRSEKDEPARLYRSKQNRVFAGVSGGIAEYLNIDPLIIRISWIAATLFAGVGIIAYIIAIFIIPENPSQLSEPRKGIITPEGSKQWGILLIVVGVFLLLGQIGVFNYFHFRHFHWQTFLALLLVSYGIYLIINRNNSTKETFQNAEPKKLNEKSFFRIEENKMIAGVCTGIAEYFNIDVTIIRLIWVLATLASGGLPIMIYILAILVFPYRVHADQYEPNGGKS